MRTDRRLVNPYLSGGRSPCSASQAPFMAAKLPAARLSIRVHGLLAQMM